MIGQERRAARLVRFCGDHDFLQRRAYLHVQRDVGAAQMNFYAGHIAVDDVYTDVLFC